MSMTTKTETICKWCEEPLPHPPLIELACYCGMTKGWPEYSQGHGAFFCKPPKTLKG